ncbi:MAG: hypothetical protein QOG83_2167, partial [Alphaproteobacteria bacterium]|nr:hypothetical protein [Alphaproteobacteria bacterium]
CVILESIYREGIRLWRDPSERGRCQAVSASIPRSGFEERLSATNEVLASVAASHPDVLAFLPTDTMCKPDCITSIEGEFLFRDSNHLRRNLSVDTLDRFVTLLGLPDLLLRLGRMRKN